MELELRIPTSWFIKYTLILRAGYTMDMTKFRVSNFSFFYFSSLDYDFRFYDSISSVPMGSTACS